MPRVASILVLLLLVAPSAAAVALPPEAWRAVGEAWETAAPLVDPAIAALTGPRTVQYVNVPGWEWYGCQVGGGPVDATGACFRVRTEADEHAWLLIDDAHVDGCVEVNVFVNHERAPRRYCAGPEGVDLGETWHVIVGFRDAGERTATTGTATLEIRPAA